MSKTISLFVEYNSYGKPVREEVHVEDDKEGRYRLLQSPGLIFGLAAGDVFTVESDGTFKIVERAGNVCIQIFCATLIEQIEQVATPAFASIGGRLDGRASKVLVYTVFIEAGFLAMENILKRLQLQFPVMEWYYGNVYDPADGVTPLNWW
jgi:hypothetical protein